MIKGTNGGAGGDRDEERDNGGGGGRRPACGIHFLNWCGVYGPE